uniref:Uncharacterized protein n=1 Tax=Oryza glumipatula TaxID=40148 RepID=A0A0D9Y7V3_9ORYZ
MSRNPDGCPPWLIRLHRPASNTTAVLLESR